MTDRYPVQPGSEPWSSPGRGDRAAIGLVVSHGFTGNPHSTRPIGEALAERGFAVEVVRLPGHGTDWRDMRETRYADWKAEVARALGTLAGAGKRVVVVGLSMGGTIAVDLAGAPPAGLAGVVSSVPAKTAGLVKNDVAKGGDEHAYERVPTRAANSMLAELSRIRAALPGLTVPVLVAYAPNDHSVPPDNSRALVHALAGKDVTELVLERSYHLATIDYDFDLLVERITAFADRVGAAG